MRPFQAQGWSTAPAYSYEVRLDDPDAAFEQLRDRDLCRLYHARLADGTAAASQLVLLGPHPVTHTVCAGATAEHLTSGASFMANEYFRASGKVPLLATIPGPGFTYAMTGLAEAWLDSAAMQVVRGKGLAKRWLRPLLRRG